MTQSQVAEPPGVRHRRLVDPEGTRPAGAVAERLYNQQSQSRIADTTIVVIESQ
jgi:hypothetical protein